jgi:hypothetical protein
MGIFVTFSTQFLWIQAIQILIYVLLEFHLQKKNLFHYLKIWNLQSHL